MYVINSCLRRHPGDQKIIVEFVEVSRVMCKRGHKEAIFCSSYISRIFMIQSIFFEVIRDIACVEPLCIIY